MGYWYRRSFSIFFFLAVTLASTLSSAAGSIKNGSAVYKRECAECHTMKDGTNKKGPSIFRLIGRKAGTIANYDYSDAIKGSGIIWSTEKLDQYIKNPNKLVPGGKMKYEGLSSAKSREDLIAYLLFFSE